MTLSHFTFEGGKRSDHHRQFVQEGVESREGSQHFAAQWEHRIQIELSQRESGKTLNLLCNELAP